MADVFDKETRSAIMRKVHSKGNRSTESRLIEIFQDNCISGWRRNYSVVGHPDFVFLKSKVAIFVDGCFWHGHHCRNITPSENAEYWSKKRERNMKHDQTITALFEKRGWAVLRIWECELKKQKQPETIQRIKSALKC